MFFSCYRTTSSILTSFVLTSKEYVLGSKEDVGELKDLIW